MTYRLGCGGCFAADGIHYHPSRRMNTDRSSMIGDSTLMIGDSTLKRLRTAGEGPSDGLDS